MNKKINQKYFGYTPNFKIKLIRFIVFIIKKIFFLDNNNLFSNEFSQSLNISKKINFDGNLIEFRTGHGRLNWRVNSFFTEEPLMIEWLKNFTKNDIFLDIGANVGIYSLAALSKGSFVYCAELDPKNLSILFENIYLNKFNDNSIIIPFALGDKKKISKIYYRDFSVGDALQSIDKESKLPIIYNKKFNMNQLVFDLDQIFKEFNFNQPNKIKIDVDGNEDLVIKGGNNIISNCKEIYIEDNGLKDDKLISDFLNQNNFIEHKKMEISKPIDDIKIYNRLFIKK